MINQEKLDWKEPHLARLKNYAIGGGYALLFVAVVLTVLYFTLKPEDALEKPAVFVETMPAVVVKSKPAVKSIRRPVDAAAPVTAVNQKQNLPVKPTEPITQFDSDLANFESKIP